MVHFGEFLKTWSLLSNSVTRQVIFKRTKIGGKCQNSNATFWVIFKQCVYLKHWCGNDVLLQKCSWWKIVRETSRQMLQNGLNWMPRLLPSYSEILLQRPRKSGKYCLSSLIRFHRHLFFGWKDTKMTSKFIEEKKKIRENHLFDCFAFVWCEWKLLPPLKLIGLVVSSISAHIRILRKIAHYVSCNLLFSKLGKQLSNYRPAIDIKWIK